MSLLDGDGIGYCQGVAAEKKTLLDTKAKGSKASPTGKQKSPMRKRRKSGDIGERMRQLEQAMFKDNFVKDMKRTDKNDPGYGRPQEGTRTAERGARAQTHVHKEILELCEVIYMNG